MTGGYAFCMAKARELLTMKTLLFAGLAGVLTAAPASAIAAVDSAPSSGAPVDLSFASSNAIAAGTQGMKAPRAKMGGMKMRGHGMRGKMRSHGMKGMKRHHGGKMRGHRGHFRKGDRGFRKGHSGRRGFRGGNSAFFFGGFPTLGYSFPSYYYSQPTYRYTQPQPSYYPVPYPVPTPVAYPAPAPTTVVVKTVEQKGKGLTKPAHVIAAQQPQPAQYDYNIVTANERVVTTPASHAGTTYRGDWDGAYRSDGSYQGEWRGTYEDQAGRVYQGEYSGTFIGDGDVRPHDSSQMTKRPIYKRPSGCDIDPGFSPEACGVGYPPQHHQTYPGYDRREQEELAYLEQCKKSSGIGGAVVGGAIGALAGNRIAGRGNRLGGSLIGGGVGALAGAAIERSTDRCRKLLKKYGYDRDYADRRDYYYQQQHAPRPPAQTHHGYGYGYGWQGYYQQPAYYYQPQPQVTTVVVQSQPVTTTTTTTTIEEEYVYEKPKYVAKKRYKPAKRVWKPRPKPAPQLKGCQQANCYYDQ